MSDLNWSTRVTIKVLFGGRNVEPLKNAMNKIIKEIKLDLDANGGDGELYMKFNDDTTLRIFDDGHSYCESRYLHTDDDLQYFVGSKFTDIQFEPTDDVPDEYGEHEKAFLRITTDKGVFTLETHNEHNGYYGHEACIVSTQLTETRYL